MPLIAKLNSGEYEPTPPGLQHAVCAFVEDCGYEPDMKGAKMQHKVVVLWELKEVMKDGRPFMISKTYTLSLGEKANLRKDLESWRGKVFTDEELKGFDLEKLKGANCTLNVVSYTKRDGSGGVKVSGVMPAQKGEVKMFAINTLPPDWVAERRKENAKNAPEAESANAPQEEPVAAAVDDNEPPF